MNMSTKNKTVKFVIAATALVLGAGCSKDPPPDPAKSAPITTATPAKAKPLTAARLATLQAYDSNRNGVLDPAERQRMEEERKARIEALKARINAQYDLNNNGALDRGEAQTMRADTNKLSVFKGAALRRYDVNHNGVLDPAENDRMVLERQELVQKARAGALAKFDINHNGQLDAQERAAMRARYQR
jgi:hypothetical protein